MEEVWKAGSTTAEQVREALAARHPMKESTTRTMLRRLEQKGYLKHRVEGRTYIYSGSEAPQHVAAKAVRSLIDRLCSGSVEQLLVGMVENDMVDERELERLVRRIARSRSRAGGT